MAMEFIGFDTPEGVRVIMAANLATVASGTDGLVGVTGPTDMQVYKVLHGAVQTFDSPAAALKWQRAGK